MCKKNRESIDHLLIQCEVAIEIWSSILNFFFLGTNFLKSIRRP
jgi:hypothetical protein